MNRHTGKPFIMPSQSYKQYETDSIWQIPPWAKLEIDQPVNLKCVYYMPTERRVDLVNLLEATCDMLVKGRVLMDDNSKIVAAHDGSRVLKDKERPRTEIEIWKVRSEEK